MIRSIVFAASLTLLLSSSVEVSAHHAFGAEFDPNRPLILKGPVTKVEWVNPHAWIHLEHTTESGDKEQWMVEGGTPNTLLRRGLNRRSLVPGTVIVVDGYQSKDRSNRTRRGGSGSRGRWTTRAPRGSRCPRTHSCSTMSRESMYVASQKTWIPRLCVRTSPL